MLRDEHMQQNRAHRDNPEPGDYWNEMFSPVALVLKVDGQLVTMLKHTKPTDPGHWTWDTDKVTVMTKRQFGKWISYDTIPDKTWCYVFPKHKHFEHFLNEAREAMDAAHPHCQMCGHEL